MSHSALHGLAHLVNFHLDWHLRCLCAIQYYTDGEFFSTADNAASTITMKLGNESDLHYIWHLMLWLPAFFPSAFTKSIVPALWPCSLPHWERNPSTQICIKQILVTTVWRIVEQRVALGHPQHVLLPTCVGACAFLCPHFLQVAVHRHKITRWALWWWWSWWRGTAG